VPGSPLARAKPPSDLVFDAASRALQRRGVTPHRAAAGMSGEKGLNFSCRGEEFFVHEVASRWEWGWISSLGR